MKVIKGTTAWTETSSLNRSILDPSKEEGVHAKALLKKRVKGMRETAEVTLGGRGPRQGYISVVAVVS